MKWALRVKSPTASSSWTMARSSRSMRRRNSSAIRATNVPNFSSARFYDKRRRLGVLLLSRKARSHPRDLVADQSRLTRIGYSDALLLETDFHAAVEFSLHRPPPGIGAFDLADNRRHRAVDFVDAP